MNIRADGVLLLAPLPMPGDQSLIRPLSGFAARSLDPVGRPVEGVSIGNAALTRLPSGHYSPQQRDSAVKTLPRRFVRLATVLVLAGMAAGANAAESALLTPMSEQPEAPGFDLSGPDGERYSLEDMRGKPVIVNFWATWCPPCRAEMPSMQRAWEQVKDEDILIVAVNVGESADTITQFNEHVKMEFPLPMDLDSRVTQRWPMNGLPTTFVVDPQGRLVYRAQGEREWDDPALLDLVRALKP